MPTGLFPDSLSFPLCLKLAVFSAPVNVPTRKKSGKYKLGLVRKNLIKDVLQRYSRDLKEKSGNDSGQVNIPVVPWEEVGEIL